MVNWTVFFLSSLLGFVLGVDKNCNITDLVHFDCSATEICIEAPSGGLGICRCRDGYRRNSNSTCQAIVKPTATDGPPNRAGLVVSDDEGTTKEARGGVPVEVVVPIVLVALVACLAYGSYRYRLVAWVRNKMNRRNVDYDEFMIGQDVDDDPPLN